MAELIRKSLFLSLFILLSCSAISAKGDARFGQIIGYVFDKDDMRPLPDVNLYIKDTMIGAASSKEGFYKIKRVPPGVYTFIVRIIGYRTMVIHNVKIGPGKTRIINIGLRKKILPMKEISVTGDGSGRILPHEISLIGHEIMRPRDVIKRPGALEDAYRVLSTLPGVTSRNDFNTQLYIRGGSPDQNLILYDGVEILTPSRLFVVMGGGISLVNPDVVGRIDLAPGGFGVEYGNKMSALIRIQTRDGRRDRVAVKTSASLVTARAVAEGPLKSGRGSWLLAGRRSFYDLLANNVYSKNYVFPFYFDLQAKIAYNLNPDQKLSAFYSHLGEGARMYRIENENMDLLNKGTGNIFGIQYHSILSPTLASNVNFGFYSDRNSVKILDTFNYKFGADLNYAVKRTSIRGDIIYYPFRPLEVKTGAELVFNRTDVLWLMDWRNYVDLPDSMSFHVNSARANSYWKAQLRVASWLDVNFGMRYDYSTIYNKAEWNPRGKLKVGLTNDMSLWYSIGAYSQFPDILTIIGRGEPLDITKNTDELGAERSLHNIVGLQWTHKNQFNAKLEIYHKRFSRLLARKDDDYVPYNTGIGTAEGVEISLQKIRNKNDAFGFWANYGFSVAKFKRTPEDDWHYLDYDQRHQVAVGIELKLYKSWILSTTYHYGSGFPYTPILAMRRDVTSVGGYLQGWDVVKADRNSARYPVYSRLDVRLSYESKGKHNISAYIDFINVLNHNNVYLYQWDFYSQANSETIGKRSVFYMLPFVPSFGLIFSL